jgi:hypothetical protein
MVRGSETKRQEFRNECEKYARKYNLNPTDYAGGLEYFALHVLALEPKIQGLLPPFDSSDELDLQEFRAGGAYDGDIDGLLYDEELSSVFIIQTKFYAKQINSDTLKEARNFFSRLDEWADPGRRSKLSNESIRLLEGSDLDPSRQEINLFFITSQTESESIELEDIEEEFDRKYAERGFSVNCKIFTQSAFLRFRDNLLSVKSEDIIPEVTLNFQTKLKFEFDNGDNRSIVGAIKATEIRNLWSQKGMGNNLFNLNIRSGLGNLGKINPKIQETAKNPEEAKNFFFYNNGITATCSDFTESDSKVTIRNFQIVNGAQTVTSLVRGLGKQGNQNIYVLIRLIETNEKYSNKSAFANNIIRYQNTQNPVKDSDFFSNDKIQLWLSSNLAEMSRKNAVPGFWYENKRGVTPPTGRKGKKVGIEDLGKLRYACLVDAPFTYKKQKEIWDSSENAIEYWKAFGSGGKPVDSWSQEELAEVCWMIRSLFYFKTKHSEVRAKARELQKSSDKPNTLYETAYLGVFARYLTALSYYGMIQLREQGVFKSFEDLIGSEERCLQIEKEVLDEARTMVRNKYPDWIERAANPRLNLPQNEESWKTFKDQMFNEITLKIAPKFVNKS